LLKKALEVDKLKVPGFSAAVDEVASVSTKTSDKVVLLAALQVRGKHFKILYDFYGNDIRSFARFSNYMGSQRVLHKLVAKVASKNTDIVVVGDADFSGIKPKGLPPGVAGKFVRQLKKELGPDRIVAGDEFRSSCLDSNTRCLMHHPPKEQAISKNGIVYVRRVFGIYQSSKAGYSCTWNRDVNAAINIVNNFRYKYDHGEMPQEFQRGVKLSASTSLRYKYRWCEEKKKFIGGSSRLQVRTIRR